MVTLEQIKKGLANFADTEILAKMQMGSLQRVALGAGVGLALSNLEKTIHLDSPAIAMLGVVNEDGTIDIDKVASELKKNFPDEGMRFEIDFLGFKFGTMVLRKSDIETLRTYIVNA